MTFVRPLAVAALLVATTSCSSGVTKPAAAEGTGPGGRAGTVATHVEFTDSQFAASSCPKAHVLANCFSGTGSATLAPWGTITISRTVVSGDQKRTTPDGCEPADTTGVLKDAKGGTAQISGAGTLCGQLAKYTLLVDHGTGSLAALHLTGTITNNGGAESWDIATTSD